MSEVRTSFVTLRPNLSRAFHRYGCCGNMSIDCEQAGRPKPLVISSLCLLSSESAQILSVMQLRQEAADWLSPPDPSVNYYTARDTHHKGTTTWFTGGSTFRDWKESGSLLWIHGKRMFLTVCNFGVITDFEFHSGLRQKRPYVCHPIKFVSAGGCSCY